MHRTLQRTTLAAVAAFGVACNELPSTPEANPLSLAALSAAFGSVPLGFSDVTSSYTGDGEGPASIWLPGGRSAGFGTNALMGGGLSEAFIGGVGRGRGFGHHGPFGGGFGGALAGALRCTGSFVAASGRFVCDPVERNGLTSNRSARYSDASGQVQQAFDTLTTNTVNVQTSVTGTVEYVRDATRGPRGRHHHHTGRIAGDTTTILTATTEVAHASERTVSGLAAGSSQRTVNGTSRGEESSTGTSSQGDFTATRIAADTTRDVIVPIQDGRPTYPTAGTVIRVMQATVTYAGQSPVSVSRREVVTYDGSDTANVTITINGTARSCTMPLPRGRLVCDS